MSLSDCEKCWDTPCTCGYQFRDYNHTRLKEFILATFNYRSYKESVEIAEEVVNELKSLVVNGKTDNQTPPG